MMTYRKLAVLLICRKTPSFQLPQVRGMSDYGFYSAIACIFLYLAITCILPVLACLKKA